MIILSQKTFLLSSLIYNFFRSESILNRYRKRCLVSSLIRNYNHVIVHILKNIIIWLRIYIEWQLNIINSTNFQIKYFIEKYFNYFKSGISVYLPFFFRVYKSQLRKHVKFLMQGRSYYDGQFAPGAWMIRAEN